MNISKEIVISKVIKKLSGKWGYEPYQSDAASDFAWHVKKELLQMIKDLDYSQGTSDLDKSLVIFDLLSSMKGNYLDETKEMYKKIRTNILVAAPEWALRHSDPSAAKNILLNLIKTLDEKILTATGKESTDDKPNLTKEDIKLFKDLENLKLEKKVKSKQEVYLGLEGQDKSWQQKFDLITDCVHCGEEARIAFVVYETYEEGKKNRFVVDLHKNELALGGSFWPHDAISCAVYFCTKCTEPTALYNQA